LCSDKGIGLWFGVGFQLTKTDYLPPDPPGYESAVMVLVGRQIRLIAIGMPLCWLDEDAMAWREFP